MKATIKILLLGASLVAACNSEKKEDDTTDSSMTDSATIGMDTSATGSDYPYPVSDSANTGTGKTPPADTTARPNP